MAAKKKVSAGTKVAIGAGLVGVAGAAYLLFGPEGKKHQKDLKNWAMKMKSEAVEKMKEGKVAIQTPAKKKARA